MARSSCAVLHVKNSVAVLANYGLLTICNSYEKYCLLRVNIALQEKI